MAQGWANGWRRAVTNARPCIGFEAIGGLDESRTDKDSVVHLAGEVRHSVDGTIVLTVGVIELYADPETG